MVPGRTSPAIPGRMTDESWELPTSHHSFGVELTQVEFRRKVKVIGGTMKDSIIKVLILAATAALAVFLLRL
jgi:hypothetical protein